MHRLSDIVAVIQEELRKISELRNLKRLNLGLFSTDLALVAHGIRYVCFCSTQQHRLENAS